MKFIVLGCAIALGTVGVHEHLIRERSPLRDVWWSLTGVVHLGYALHISCRISSRKKGPSMGTILFVLCVSQYLDVSA